MQNPKVVMNTCSAVGNDALCIFFNVPWLYTLSKYTEGCKMNITVNIPNLRDYNAIQ